MALSPSATNTVECSVCAWKRILDPMREYRSGHTNPASLAECHEQLVYTEVTPTPPEIYLLDEPEAYASIEGGPSPEQVAALAALYELEDEDVDTALAAAAAS